MSGPFDPDPVARTAALAELRDRCPVARLGPGGPWIGLSHSVVSDGLRRVTEFASSAGQDGVEDEDKTIAGLLEPRHGALRRVINAVVAFHRSQKIAGYLEELVDGLLDGLLREAGRAGDAGVDVMPWFCEPIPPAAIARLMGFPESDAARYYAWADHLAERFAEAAAHGHGVRMVDACPEAAAYVEDRIDERMVLDRSEWPQDALTRFLVTEIDGERLSRRAIVPQVMFLIGAGSETTRNLLGSMLYRIALDPDLYKRLRQDEGLVDAVVEEALRIDPPALFMVRTCLSGAQLGPESIPAGDRIFLSLSAANTDPEVFSDPERFDPSRSSRDHVAFGAGPHICPGAALARLEARTALSRFVARVRSVHLAGGYEFDHAPTGMLHGPRTLRLVLAQA